MYKLYCFFQEYLWIFLLSLPTRGAWIEITSSQLYFSGSESLPTRGAWIEISTVLPCSSTTSRSPHGERGLKFYSTGYLLWHRQGRSPHGERGLKYLVRRIVGAVCSRSPHGERGLKLLFEGPLVVGDASLPTRGAWIEISAPSPPGGSTRRRSPHGERGLK